MRIDGVIVKPDESEIWTIKETTIKLSSEDVDEVPYRIDPLKSPKWIDLGDPASFVEPGLYKLEGDELTIRLTTVGKGNFLFEPLAVLATLAVGLWLASRWRRGPLAGFLVFSGTLFPVLGFLNVYPFLFSWVADHYQYLATL